MIVFRKCLLTLLVALASVPAGLILPPSMHAAKLSVRVTSVINSGFDYVLWVDGIKYPTMAACYADIPSTGGVCMVPPNYSETLAASITCNKSYSGFVFTGPASIVAGSNQFVVTAGTRSCFLDSWVPFGSSVATAGTGVEWNYTGSASAFVVGGSGSDTLGFRIKDITIFLNDAGSAAVGLNVIRTTVCEIKNVHIIGPGGTVSQQGIILDGTGNYTGCRIDEPIITGVLKGIQLTGSGVFAGNANKIVGGQISSPATGASMGIDFEAGSSGNTIIGTDVEQMSVAYNFSGTSQGNYVIARSEANTSGATFGANTSSNEVHLINTINPCIQGGANNICTNGTSGTGTKTITSSAVQTFTQACSGVAKPAAKLAMQWVGGACASSARDLQMPMASAGSITNLRVRCGAGGRTASSGAFSLRKNGAASLLACTVGTGTTCNDTTHSVPVLAGDALQLSFTTQPNETLASCGVSFEKH